MFVLVEFLYSDSHILPVFCGWSPGSQIQTPQGYLLTFREQRLPRCTLDCHRPVFLCRRGSCSLLALIHFGN